MSKNLERNKGNTNAYMLTVCDREHMMGSDAPTVMGMLMAKRGR
jgi:hypothetical protein